MDTRTEAQREVDLRRVEPSSNPDFDAVIRRAGGCKGLGDALGVSRIAVQQWRRRGWMPPERAKQCRELYGESVDVRKLINPKLAAIISS